MEVYIPFLGNPGDVVMLFQSGGGYNPSPNGPSCPFISREAEELVPLPEIRDTLTLLEVDHNVFWSIEDHSEDSSLKETPIPASAPSAITKPKDSK
jgi:hypothetical protein